jgi:hypothetical protein
MADQDYRYKAFISYRHVDRDRRWARWLIEGLETFRTPHSLLARGVPSRIGHLFRDDDEIPASSNLSAQIEEALKQSQFLIVVCSPDTPQSVWVRHEIEYFRSLGKGDHILALLVEGEPTQSFPPELLHVPYEKVQADGSKTIELRDEEPIAADVRKRSDEPLATTHRRALLRVSATLLGCSFDDLAQRDHRRQVRRRRIIGSAIATGVLIAAATGGWWWDYTRIKTAYYADVGTRWSEPFGIGDLSFDAAAHRYVSYRIEMQRGHVIEVRRENGEGSLRALKGDEVDADPWNSSVAEWRVRYQGDRVGTMELYSATGRLVRTESYRFFPDGQSGLVAFTQAKGIATALSSKVSAFQTQLGAGIEKRQPEVTQHRLAFSPEGFVARRTFETVWGTPTRDENGSAGRAYTCTPAGQVASVRNLDIHGGFLISKSGVAEERRSYTPQGDLTQYELFDRSGALLSSIVARFDAVGNRVERLWFGPGGKPRPNEDDAVPREADDFDSHGNMVHRQFLDETGRPTLSKLGYAQLSYDFDDKGHITRTNYLGIDGKLVLAASGVAGAKVQYDALGNVTAVHLFGTDGKPKLGSDGFAASLISFDANGWVIESRWLGVDGRLIARADGIAVIHDTYDARGNNVVEAYLDAAAKPVAGPQGFARIDRKFDERGDETEETYFGIDGKPVSDKQGVARETISYTEAGFWSQVNFFGLQGEPVLNARGVARADYEYDERGNPTMETFYGTSGERVLSTNGYSRLEQLFDASDNVVGQRNYGVDDKLVLNKNGYASVRSRFDARGNDVEDQFFGTDGKPILTTKGYARSVSVYDARNEVIEQRNYDTAGRPTGGISGIASYRIRFNDRGQQTEFATFGADGKLFMTALGYAMVRDAFDAHGAKTDEFYFGADGAPILWHGKYAHVHLRYKSDGSVPEVTIFDAQDKPLKLQSAQ